MHLNSIMSTQASKLHLDKSAISTDVNKYLAKQMLITDAEASQRRHRNNLHEINGTLSSKVTDTNPLDTLSQGKNPKLVSHINRQFGVPFDPYHDKSDGLDHLLSQHHEMDLQNELMQSDAQRSTEAIRINEHASQSLLMK